MFICGGKAAAAAHSTASEWVSAPCETHFDV